MLKAIFWDNDGVLVDTEKLFYLAAQQVLATVGVVLTTKNLSPNPMTPRWVGNGPDARRRIEAYLTVDVTLRSDNQADGPFLAHPPGDASFARTRRRSSSPYLSIDTPRRRSLIAGEICIVAGPLGSEIDSNDMVRSTRLTIF